MDGLDPDHVLGFALNPRPKTDLGEFCTLSLIVDVMRSPRDKHHPALACFWIEVIDLHVNVVLGTGDASTQVLFGKEGPVCEEDDRILKDLVLKRERERPVAAVVEARCPILSVLRSSMDSASSMRSTTRRPVPPELGDVPCCQG
jgi:hypothetical protein